jgi:hypothetical protein
MKPGPERQESSAGIKAESQVTSRFPMLDQLGESRYRAFTSYDHPFG